MFQFHTGSIKAIPALQHGKEGQFRFNSTLVRLKQELWDVIDTGLSLFQFHTGSIKAATFLVSERCIFTGFNSTLVRLKQLPLYL